MIRVGCSGWVYKHWAGDFYPAHVKPAEWFPHYAGIFDTVEINNSFYRLPEWRTFAGWAGKAREVGTVTGQPFLYAVKASRFLTHMKRLIDPGRPARSAAVSRAASRRASRADPVSAAAAMDSGPYAVRSVSRGASANNPGVAGWRHHRAPAHR